MDPIHSNPPIASIPIVQEKEKGKKRKIEEAISEVFEDTLSDEEVFPIAKKIKLDKTKIKLENSPPEIFKLNSSFPSPIKRSEETVAGLMELFIQSSKKESFDFSKRPFNLERLERFKKLLFNHVKSFKKEGITKEHFGYIEKYNLDPKQKPQIYVRADLHGGLRSLIKDLEALQKQGLLDENYKCKPGTHLVFLGDYCDRGEYGTEILELLMRLREENPKQVHLIRGNHEYTAINKDHGKEDESLQTLLKDKEGENLLESFYETLSLTTYLGVAKGLIDHNQRKDLIQEKEEDVATQELEDAVTDDEEVTQDLEKLMLEEEAEKKQAKEKRPLISKEGIEYVQFTHGLFEVTMDPSSLLDSQSSEGYLPVPKIREFSNRIKKIFRGDPLFKSAARIKEIFKLSLPAMQKVDHFFTTYNWGDVAKKTELGLPNRRRYKLSPEDIKHYLKTCSDFNPVKVLFRGHQHVFEELTDKDEVVVITLPIGADVYKKSHALDIAYILSPQDTINKWTKRAILRKKGDGISEVTKEHSLITPVDFTSYTKEKE